MPVKHLAFEQRAVNEYDELHCFDGGHRAFAESPRDFVNRLSKRVGLTVVLLRPLNGVTSWLICLMVGFGRDRRGPDRVLLARRD